MKIFCIGLNYREHIDEMKHFSFPDNPVIFMKPPTALLKDKQPLYYPDFSNDVHYEGEIVLKISKNGKKIEEKFAHKYYDSFSLGFDFTARDIQADLKKKGWPIKQTLLDQSVLSGIGNIYSDEMLWSSCIHPRSVTGKIPEKELGSLLKT